MAIEGERTAAVSQLRRLAAWAIWILIGTCALVVSGRAIATVWGPVLSTPAVCALATALVLLGLAAWSLWLSANGRADRDSQLGSGLLSAAVPLLIGFSLSGGVGIGGLCYLVFLLLASVLAITTQCCQELPAGIEASVDASSRRIPGAMVQASEPRGEPETVLGLTGTAGPGGAACGDAFEDSAVTQRIVRRRTPGGDFVEALLRVAFQPGEREVALHIPLWPALATTPTVECEPLDDSAVEPRVTVAQTYGVRIEVRRSGSIDAAAVVPLGVQIAAIAKAEAAA
jgi:hypothetical protein